MQRRFLLAVVLAVVLAAVAAGSAPADVLTVSGDALRTGWDSNEPRLSPSEVGAADFGQLFSTTVDGQVYAQPLVVGNTLLVTTENAKAYGIDKVSGAIRWSRSLGTPFTANEIGCGDLTPNLGSTSTPVVDPATNTMYMTTKTTTAGQVRWHLHALSVTNGAERAGWPVEIQGTPADTPGVPFIPRTAMQRPGLLLMGGVVYLAFGAHCDINPYRGYVVGVSTSTAAITSMWTTVAGPGTGDSSMAGIWQSGGGLVSDGPGRIFAATGNGISPPAAPGSPTPKTLAESVVRLGVDGTGALTAQDFFSPADAPILDQNDTDFGSGGPAGLPAPAFGTPEHPHLLVVTGKDGRVWLLDRDQLGGRMQAAGGGDAALGMSGPFGGVWGHPGVYGGEGGWVYQIESYGALRALQYGTDGSGRPTLSSAGTSSGGFGYTSGSPVVTSDGTTPGSAIVWALYSSGSSGAGGQLRAYRAIPSGGVLDLLWSAPIGTASKFAVPATDSGRVYVGTRDGKVIGFGRPAAPALITGPLDFGTTPVGQVESATTTVTATRDVRVTSVTAPAPFAGSATLPRLLHAGDTLAVQVDFAPTAPGDRTGQLSLRTDTGTFALDLHGYGTAPGLLAQPGALNFGSLATGTGKTLAVTITNTWTQAETITGVGAPAAPFSLESAPAAGTTLAPQASVTIPVRYAPATAGSDAGSFVVSSDQGDVTVTLAGQAQEGAPRMELSPNPLDFGSVPLGSSRTLSFDVKSTGNLPLVITKAKAPTGAFSSATPLGEGLTLPPETSVHQQVTFTPTAAGPVTGTYLVTGDDGQGAQLVQLTGVGVPRLAPATEWSLNGTAAVSKKAVDLTQASQGGAAGSAVSPLSVNSEGLTARFTFTIDQGSGADGLTFALLPGDAPLTSLGASGGALGWSGLPGYAVAFDTYQNGTDPSANFVGIAAATGGGDSLDWVRTNASVPALQTGRHGVTVSVRKGKLSVAMDGSFVFRNVVLPAPLPAVVRPAFTAGTGGLTNRHRIVGSSITFKP